MTRQIKISDFYSFLVIVVLLQSSCLNAQDAQGALATSSVQATSLFDSPPTETKETLDKKGDGATFAVPTFEGETGEQNGFKNLQTSDLSRELASVTLPSIAFDVTANDKASSVPAKTVSDQVTLPLGKAPEKPDDQKKEEVKTEEAPKKEEQGEQYTDVDDLLAAVFEEPELQQKISLHVDAAQFSEVIAMITQLSQLEIMVDPDVTGIIKNINCDDCSVGDILRFMCITHDPQLAVVKYFNTWQIMRYEKAKSLVTEQLEMEFEYQIFYITHAKFDQSFQTLARDMWRSITRDPAEKKTYISFDAVTKSIFVHGLKPQIQQFKLFLQEFDRQILQVRLDIVLVSALKTYVSNMGFNWSGVYNKQATLAARKTAFGFAGAGARLDEFPTPDSGYTVNADGTYVPLVNTNLLVDPLNFALNFYTDVFHKDIQVPLIFGGSDLNKKRLNMLLNAADSTSQVKVLARPSVLTNDHEVAELFIGEELPLQTIVKDTIQGEVRNVTTFNFKPTGIQIKIRPSVHVEKKIILLDIFIESNAVTGKLGTSIQKEGTLQATATPPVITTVRAQSKVFLSSGQTTVIGGLILNSFARTLNTLPFISKIPLIGWFFKGTAREERDLEFLVFITPTLIS